LKQLPNSVEKYYFLPKLSNVEYQYQNIFVTNMALHTAVTQAEVTFVDAIKIA